jgi:hypothetical protein
MTKEEAGRIAKEVAAKLGAPWKPYVWENLGWHASVEFGGGYIHRGGGGLTLYINIHGAHGESRSYSVMGINRTLGDGRTPLAAVREAHAELGRVRDEAAQLMIPLYAALKKAKAARKARS